MGRWERIAGLDPDCLIREIVDISFLNILENLFCCINESCIDILCGLSRCLEKDKFVFPSKFRAFLIADFSFALKVLLVSHENNCHTLVSMLQHLF